MYFNCNFCGGKIEGEEAWIGLESECPYCNKKITVPAPEAIQLPPGPPPKGGDLAKTGPPATIDGGQGVSRNSLYTETNRNSGLSTEGVAVLLDHPRMDWTEDLAARIGRLPKMLVWGSIVGAVVLFIFAAVVFRRPAVERQYINQLLEARKTTETALKYWKGGSIDSFYETMRDLVRQTNAIGATGTKLVTQRPELKDNVDAVGFHGDMNMSPGNPSVEPRLRDLERSIDQALDALHVSHPK